MEEDKIIEQLTDNDLDTKMLFKFFYKLNGTEASNREEVRKDFIERGLFVKTDSGTYKPKLVVLLFAYPNPSKIIPQLIVEFGVFEDRLNKGRPIVAESLMCSLPEAMLKLEELLKSNIRKGYVVDGFSRKTIYEYPIPVLRETIINALVHRDLGMHSRVFVEVYQNDCIRVYNPGGLLLKSILPDMLKNGDYRPLHRNPRLVQCAYFYKFAEGKGEGMRTIFSEMKRNGLAYPEIVEKNGGVEISLFGPGEEFEPNRYVVPDIGFSVSEDIIDQLGDRSRDIVKSMLATPSARFSNEWIRETFDVSRDTAHKDILELLKANLIIKEGAGRSTRYKFNPDFNRS